MAMVIQNNMAAIMTLGELNKNNNTLGKQIKKVSSGMRINGAGDDASGYAISERMRAQIRSLDQDTQNVQNGKSLLRIAEGGIQNIIEEIRTLKELALNAANDTNTDLDRATIQKEFENRKANINDIATETNYNGKTLLDGTYTRPDGYVNRSYRTETETVTVTYLDRKYIRTPAISPIPKIRYYTEKELNSVSGFTKNFSPASEKCKDIGAGTSWDGTQCTKRFVGSPADFSRTSSQIAVDIDFSAMKKTDESPLNIPDDLHEQGFTILCGACSQFINIKFDKNLTAAQSTYSASHTDRDRRDYVIGISGVTTADELEAALFEGIKNAAGKPTTPQSSLGKSYYKVQDDSDDDVFLDENHNVRIAKKEDGSGYVFLKNNDSFSMCFYDEGTYVQRAVEEYPIIYNVEVQETPRTVTETRTIIVEDEEFIGKPGNPLVIHHGTKANQALNVYINDMHTWALKTDVPSDDDILELGRLDGTKAAAYQEMLNEAAKMTLDDAKVVTQHDANVALRVIDGALQYALNEVTHVGAYISRLDFTESNLVTANESTQASESTLRDADMAKEMMEYTKANVLAQASQSMLAQANQNSSQVMSLLQ